MIKEWLSFVRGAAIDVGGGFAIVACGFGIAAVFVLALELMFGSTSTANAQSRRGQDVDCYLTTTATTSTLITGCHAPEPGMAIYITDISVYGDAVSSATAVPTIQSGTGGTCSSPKVHYACQHPVVAGCEAHWQTGVRATGEVCLLDATVGTKWVSIKGYIAPK